MSDAALYLLTLHLLSQTPEVPPKPPADAPLAQLDAQPLDVRVVQKNDPSPDRGCWMDEPTCMATAKTREDLKAQNDKLMERLSERPKFQWVPLVLGLGVGLVAGYFVHAAAFPNRPAALP